jgi:aryl-alcohol dehydrogenase-like predicted oxidoreductase
MPKRSRGRFRRFSGVTRLTGTSPDLCATHSDQLPEIFAAIDLKLDADVLKKIDQVSREIRYPMN